MFVRFPWRRALCCRVAQAYVNQKKLDTETKILQANATHFAKQTMQWLKLVEDFNQSLKVKPRSRKATNAKKKNTSFSLSHLAIASSVTFNFLPVNFSRKLEMWRTGRNP